ncbi:histidinol-phosphate transaminase [Methylovulum psychrotolerans]|uniref:Histidinol-phosphate aminotransferase n=1 Tax=Methylovulum psychrotolerans TaxID=1704499 RepID=A0A2S5CJF8_9GAMM|nr:histidinol-phosphate transaminase [Methylovulum psychrotolerans]POZ50948.1 histidinol-phosphate transaminase [Methylovulum psychrotolerans]
MKSVVLSSSLFRPEILALSAYKVADASGMVKLDAMENPYHWPEDIKAAWLAELQDCPINRYPDPEARQLAATLREVEQIPADFDILLGNGSDEIIQMLLMALPPTASVLAPAPGFVMYKQLSDSLSLRYHAVPLVADGFGLDLPALLATIAAHQPSVIFLAYPNNPTANLFDPAAMIAIIEAAHGLVVIDEAYAPFAHATFMDKLAAYDNLLVMRTVSKLGLAGLRLGYLVGQPKWLGELNKIRLPYNINSLTQITADFALRHKPLFDGQTQRICEQRAVVMEHINALPGLLAYPSAANFILFKTPSGQADAIFAALKAQGVLIKNLSPQGGLLADCLRVTVGTPEENAAFLQALGQSLKD